ncbi:hypothetical protein SNEBB_005405 [Seison nebaliae]|nr:hypothetical protein SNEBB_005405 [Seison nebaliae]
MDRIPITLQRLLCIVVFLSTLDEDFGNIRFTGAARLVLFLEELLSLLPRCQRSPVFILEIVLMAMLIENRSLTQSFLMKYLDKQKYNREKKFFEPNDQNNINRFIRDNVSSSQFHVIENTFGCCGLNGVEDYYSKELSTISLPRTCLNVVKNMGGNFNTLTFDDYQLINSSVVSEPINDQSSFINFINRRAGKIQTMCDNNIREVESIQQTVPNIPIGCRHILPEYFRTRFTSMLSMNISAVLITISYIIISFMFLVTSKKLI